MKTKLMGAAVLAAAMGSSVASHAQTITYNDISSALFRIGTPISLSSLITPHQDPGTIAGQITIFGSPDYIVSGALNVNGTNTAYNAALWGSLGDKGSDLGPSYTGVTITPETSGVILIGGGTYDFVPFDAYSDFQYPGSPEVWSVILNVNSSSQRPKPTLAQKAGAAAELATMGGLAVVGGVIGGAIFALFTPLVADLGEIVRDPDDPNYMVLVTPDAPDFVTLPGLPSWTGQQLATWDDFVNNLELSEPIVQAMANSIDRAQGAYDAGNEYWADAQFANFEDYYQENLGYATAINADAASLGLLSVPESSTWAMMLIGFAGLGYAGFRRASKARLE